MNIITLNYSSVRSDLLLTVLGIFSAGIMILSPSRADAQVRTPDLNSTMSAFNQKLANFEGSRDLNDLKQALSILESFSIDIDHPQNDPARRHASLQGWSKLFQEIDQASDHTYNINDQKHKLFLCLVPPVEADGRQLPSCANPKDIRDPKARSEYEQMLRIDEQNKRKFNFEFDLQSIDRDAIGEASTVLANFQFDLKETRAQFNSDLTQAGISQARIDKIDKELNL